VPALSVLPVTTVLRVAQHLTHVTLVLTAQSKQALAYRAHLATIVPLTHNHRPDAPTATIVAWGDQFVHRVPLVTNA